MVESNNTQTTQVRREKTSALGRSGNSFVKPAAELTWSGRIFSAYNSGKFSADDLEKAISKKTGPTGEILGLARAKPYQVNRAYMECDTGELEVQFVEAIRANDLSKAVNVIAKIHAKIDRRMIKIVTEPWI